MPPQPLSSKFPRGGAHVVFDPATLYTYPKLGNMVLYVIAQWAHIDIKLTEIMTNFLKSDYLVVFAMLQGLSGAEAKRGAIDAAAVQALSPDDMLLYRAVMKIIKPSRERRNEFAHHIWGTCREVPNALVLMHPKHQTKTTAILRHHLHGKVTGADPEALALSELPRNHGSNMFVFYEKDLLEDVELVNSCLAWVHALSLTLAGKAAGSRADRSRQQLLAVPQIAQALQTLSKGGRNHLRLNRLPQIREAELNRFLAFTMRLSERAVCAAIFTPLHDA